MKLIAQIAGGILLAGFISWVLWLTAIAGLPTTTLDLSHMPASLPKPSTRISRPAPAIPWCENYVQRAKGERHCLENAPRAEYRVEPATLEPRHLTPMAH